MRLERISRYYTHWFMEDRHHTVGMMLGLVVFTQHSLGTDLPADVIEHPLFQEVLWSRHPSALPQGGGGASPPRSAPPPHSRQCVCPLPAGCFTVNGSNFLPVGPI